MKRRSLHGVDCHDLYRIAQSARQTRQRAAGSLSGSPCTSMKCAGPPTVSLPACGSRSTAPPRQVAAPSASQGSSPARTSASTSQARWPARTEPPPKSLPAAIGTPAACAARTLAWATSSRSADRKSTRLNSSHSSISYAVFCLKKKKNATAVLHHTKKKNRDDQL